MLILPTYSASKKKENPTYSDPNYIMSMAVREKRKTLHIVIQTTSWSHDYERILSNVSLKSIERGGICKYSDNKISKWSISIILD